MKRVMALMMALILWTTVAQAAFSSDMAEQMLSGMTIEEKDGQMMAVSFRVWKEVPTEETLTVENTEQTNPAVNITELNDEIRACLTKYHFGSVVLFAQNCQDAEQTLRLVMDMQSANAAGSRIPLLISTDQEGGSVTRLGFGTSGVGNMALAAT